MKIVRTSTIDKALFSRSACLSKWTRESEQEEEVCSLPHFNQSRIAHRIVPPSIDNAERIHFQPCATPEIVARMQHAVVCRSAVANAQTAWARDHTLIFEV